MGFLEGEGGGGVGVIIEEEEAEEVEEDSSGLLPLPSDMPGHRIVPGEALNGLPWDVDVVMVESSALGRCRAWKSSTSPLWCLRQTLEMYETSRLSYLRLQASWTFIFFVIIRFVVQCRQMGNSDSFHCWV